MPGTPGSFGIPQTTTQLLINVLDFGMDLQSAIEAPRCRVPEQIGGSAPEPKAGLLLSIESRVPAPVRAQLEERGHILQLEDEWTAGVGGMQGVGVDPATKTLSGGADPRRDGYVIGW